MSILHAFAKRLLLKKIIFVLNRKMEFLYKTSAEKELECRRRVWKQMRMATQLENPSF
jgi:hypothetical protein